MSALLRQVNAGLFADVELEARAPRCAGRTHAVTLCTPAAVTATAGVLPQIVDGGPLPTDVSGAPLDDPAGDAVTP